MFIRHVLTTEKAVAGIEKDNKLVFVVNEKATKADVKKELEIEYKEKVKSVRTLNSIRGHKKAVVLFARKGAAADLAGKLKVI